MITLRIVVIVYYAVCHKEGMNYIESRRRRRRRRRESRSIELESLRFRIRKVLDRVHASIYNLKQPRS